MAPPDRIHLNIPDFLAPLTQEEEALLDLYKTVKTYEREAALAVSAAAKAKLVASDEKYHRQLIATRDVPTKHIADDGVKLSKADSRKRHKSTPPDTIDGGIFYPDEGSGTDAEDDKLLDTRTLSDHEDEAKKEKDDIRRRREEKLAR